MIKIVHCWLWAIVLLYVVGTSNAQRFSRDFWHDGEMDLPSGETLRGKIKYDLETENIILQLGNAIKSFSPKSLDAFEILDQLTGKQRNFYSLPYTNDQNHLSNLFFELLSEGKLSLLSREKLVERVQNYYDPYWQGGRNIRVVLVVDTFYFMKANGTIVICESNLDAVLAIMDAHKEEITNFVKKNKLNLEARTDMIKVTEYYNTLSR